MKIDYTPALAPLGLQIGWGDDGNIIGRENLTPEQSAALDAAIAAYDPVKAARDAACVKCRDACKAYIYAFYSQEKQLNIGADEAARATAPPPPVESMYTHDDFLRMHAFKNEARTICNLACAEIDSKETVEEVDALIAELEFLYGLEVSS